MRRSFFAFISPRLKESVAAGLLCAFLVTLIARLGLLGDLENRTLDQLFRSRGARSPDPRITIVVADNATVERFKQWPLPRGLYGRVIDKLSQSGARTVALDILFSVPSSSREDDELLVRACQKSGRVVQAATLFVPLAYNPVVPDPLSGAQTALPSRFSIRDFNAPARTADWVASALPALQANAAAIGHINVHPELDGTLRRVPHLIRFRQHVYPSLSLAAAAHFMGLKPGEITGDNGAVRFAPRNEALRQIPLDTNGEALINWAGGNDTYPTYNFNQLLDGEVPPVALKGRLILVGITAAGSFEHHPMPFSPVQPAVEFQASAINDLLLNRPLHEIGWRLQWALLLVFSIAMGVWSAPRKIVGATLWLTLLLGMLWLGSVGAMAIDYYAPPVAPMLSVILTYAVVLAGNYRREWENNWRADASVAALARGGALMASGRARDRLLEMIRDTAREVLQAREVFLVLEDEIEKPKDELNAARLSRALREAATLIAAGDGPVLWSTNVPDSQNQNARSTQSEVAAPKLILRGVLEQLCLEIAAIERPISRLNRKSASVFNSLVAAPFARQADEEKNAVRGVLLVLGREDGQLFTSRDAILLQALGEQAALALENLAYYERLQNRIELANRHLREAYDVLSDERANLAQERAKLAAAVESMESALVISDENGCAVFDNGMGRGLIWDTAPALGESVPARLSVQLPELAALFERLDSQTCDPQNGDVPQKVTFEMTRVLEHGVDAPRRRILAAQLTPLLADDGTRLGSMLVVSDVTAERELECMKSDFVSFVAHELRTPLTSINGFASLLKMGRLKIAPEEQVELLGSIEDQCARLNRLISDLLEVARLEPGHGIAVRPEPFDLAALCVKVVNRLQALILPKENLTLQISCQHAELWAELDPDRVEQVLLNLLSNAIKYSPDGGCVSLDLRACEETFCLEVSDTGMGMTPEQVAQLFQKFYRTPDAQTRGIKGSGLGLYLVKHLVEAHGGNVAVQSEIGCGTTFLVTMPRFMNGK